MQSIPQISWKTYMCIQHVQVLSSYQERKQILNTSQLHYRNALFSFRNRKLKDNAIFKIPWFIPNPQDMLLMEYPWALFVYTCEQKGINIIRCSAIHHSNTLWPSFITSCNLSALVISVSNQKAGRKVTPCYGCRLD